MHTPHNIVASEAFAAERHGSRLASQRPPRRIAADPATADWIMLWLAGACLLGTVAFAVVAS